VATERSKPSKNRGRPQAGDERTKRRTRATEKAARGVTTAAASTVKRGDQYRVIYQEWRSGIDCSTIAAKYDLTPRRVQQIVDDLRAEAIDAMPIRSRPLGKKIMEEMLVQMNSSVSEAAQLIALALDAGNLPVALGAMKRRDEARLRLLETLKELGVIPRPLGALAAQEDNYEVGERALTMLIDRGVPEQVVDEFVASLGMDTVRNTSGHLVLDMSDKTFQEDLRKRLLDHHVAQIAGPESESVDRRSSC
jgi:hypothetical protein